MPRCRSEVSFTDGHGSCVAHNREPSTLSSRYARCYLVTSAKLLSVLFSSCLVNRCPLLCDVFVTCEYAREASSVLRVKNNGDWCPRGLDTDRPDQNHSIEVRSKEDNLTTSYKLEVTFKSCWMLGLRNILILSEFRKWALRSGLYGGVEGK